MDQQLNVLIQSSEFYAPFAGVMLTSLFENNKDIVNITVYLMTSDMSEKNRERFQSLAVQYRRKIKFVDMKEIDSFLANNRVPQYRGAYTAYYKIFALSVIKDTIDRLIYLDSDTVINGSLAELAACDLGGHMLGMCIDAIPAKYKKLIGCESKDYYNTGMIVFDVRKWKEREGADRVIKHMTTVHAAYPLTDQDLLNIVLSEEVQTLPLAYNVNSGSLWYKDYHFFTSANGLENYYSEEEFNRAIGNPVILHCMGTFGGRPWHEGDHAAKEPWGKYLRMSPWKNFKYQKNELSSVDKIQRFLFKNTPHAFFSAIHLKCWQFSLWKQVRRLGV